MRYPCLLVLTSLALLSLGADDTRSSSGWRVLFDGKNLDHFDQVGSAKWRVEDGVIVGGQDGDPKRSGLLTTKDQFKDFEIELEVMIGKHAPALGVCFVVPGRDAAGEDRPVLCVHGRPDESQVDLAIAMLKQQVENHMIPAKVLLLDDLPLTPNGKPNRRAIAHLASQALKREQVVEDSLLC